MCLSSFMSYTFMRNVKTGYLNGSGASLVLVICVMGMALLLLLWGLVEAVVLVLLLHVSALLVVVMMLVLMLVLVVMVLPLMVLMLGMVVGTLIVGAEGANDGDCVASGKCAGDRGELLVVLVLGFFF